MPDAPNTPTTREKLVVVGQTTIYVEYNGTASDPDERVTTGADAIAAAVGGQVVED